MTGFDHIYEEYKIMTELTETIETTETTETTEKKETKPTASLEDIRAAGEILELSATAGMLILESGGETGRVEDTIIRMCGAAGFPGTMVSATPTAIYMTLIGHEPKIRLSLVQRTSARVINLTMLDQTNRIARAFIAGEITAEEAAEKLAELRAPKPKKKTDLPVNMLVAAFSVAMFTLVYGGKPMDAVVSAVCGAVTVLIQSLFGKTARAFITQFVICLLGGAAIGALSAASLSIPGVSGIYMIAIGAMVPLLPGLALTSAIRDTIMGDLVSGVARFAEVTMSALSLAGGMGASLFCYITLTGQQIGSGGTAALDMPVWRLMLFGVLAVAPYSVMMHAPKKAIPAAALLGGAVYTVYAVLAAAGSPYLGYFLSTLLAASASEVLARILKMPSAVFLFPGIIILVPGMGLYETMLCVVRGAPMMALSLGSTVLICAGLMALSMAVTGVAARSVRFAGKNRSERK